LKNTPYQTFINAYPRSPEQLHKVMEENRQLFASVGVVAFVRVSPAFADPFFFGGGDQERNFGLIVQAFRRAPRWMLKKLTATYLTLGIADIAKAIKVESEAEVRNLLLNMVRMRVPPSISADY